MASRSSSLLSGWPRSRRRPLLIGAAFFLALLAAAGILGPAGCALDVTGLPPPPPKACSTDAECDDTNLCTDDVCTSKQCEHPPSAYVPDDHNECTVDS